jgi:hypothetical protein
MRRSETTEPNVADRLDLAKHFHVVVKIPRERIFGSADEGCRPINLPDDAKTMFAGYVGEQFTPGHGLLLLAINPGGGGDKYVRRTPEDEIFYPLLAAFKAAAPSQILESFERINGAFPPIVRGWNLWRILGPTLNAAGRSLDEVAYMNVVPYRTRGDKLPPTAARRAAWDLIVKPTLGVLKPRAIVTLGKKAESVITALSSSTTRVQRFCVPRTIGDSYVSPEAESEFARMRLQLCDA